MDPIIGGALILGGAGLLGAGGNIGAGFAQDSTLPSSEQVRGFMWIRMQNPLFSGLEFDASTGLGFGDAYRLSGPPRRSVTGWHSSQSKRSGGARRSWLAAIARYPELSMIDALYQVQTERGSLGAPRRDIALTTLNVLNRLGYDEQALQDLGRRERAFNQQRQELIDAGLGGLQNQIILDRARQAQQINQLNTEATGYAAGGSASPLMQNFIDRRTQALDRAEETALLRAANTGQRPGNIERDFADLRANTEMAAFADTIQAAGALQQLFSGNECQQNEQRRWALQAQGNALNTAANQANVANQIAAQGQMAEGAARATGIAQGVGGLMKADRQHRPTPDAQWLGCVFAGKLSRRRRR